MQDMEMQLNEREASLVDAFRRLPPDTVSVQTAERYLGCKQRLQNAVNDRIGIEPTC
jgi:hypothetical protein